MFCLFLALFMFLRSNDYTAVDGALRCLGVFHDRNLLFHGNNHLLYPLWVSLWARSNEALGIVAGNAFEFIRITQAMNAFLGAATIAMLYTLLESLTSYRMAVLCTLVFGLATAVLQHATNSAEPLPGVFCSVLGVKILIAGLRRNSRLGLVCAGFCFAVGLASYQAMAPIAGIGAFICVWWSVSSRKRGDTHRHALAGLLWVGLGGLSGVVGIYGAAYSYQHIPIAEMPRQFLSLPGSEVYGGPRASRILNVPFGLIRNLFGGLPSDYSGIRSLLQHSLRAVWIPIVILGMVPLALIVWLVAKAWWTMARGSSGALMVTGLGACALLGFPLVYWDPMYDKLWLLPLAAGASIVAISFRPGALPPWQQTLLPALLVGLLIIEIGINVPRMVRSHAAATPHLLEAEELNGLVGPRDWVVLDFDDVSSLWLAVWGQNAKVLLLPSSTPARARDWLSSAKQDCEQGDAKMLFVGVLDQDREAWDAFLGSRVGIPFGLLDEYRTHATVLKRYPVGKGTITVRQYKPTSVASR